MLESPGGRVRELNTFLFMNVIDHFRAERTMDQTSAFKRQDLLTHLNTAQSGHYQDGITMSVFLFSMELQRSDGVYKITSVTC